jgi:hypothetical protein
VTGVATVMVSEDTLPKDVHPGNLADKYEVNTVLRSQYEMILETILGSNDLPEMYTTDDTDERVWLESEWLAHYNLLFVKQAITDLQFKPIKEDGTLHFVGRVEHNGQERHIECGGYGLFW